MIIDIVQKVTLLVMSTSDLGTTADPYQRALRSPKKQDDAKRDNDDKARSPSIDQVIKIYYIDISILFLFFFFLRKYKFVILMQHLPYPTLPQ